MKSNYYGSNCSRCQKPETSCGCAATACSVKKYMTVQIEKWDCAFVYEEGACVGLPSGYYKSMVANNTVDPSIGVQTNPQSWIGPLSLCELMAASSGSTGASGPQGSQGLRGIQGESGIDGSVGPQGNRGSEGLQGIQGVQGAVGVSGTQGSIGLQGIQGLQGNTGNQGAQGNAGVQGVVGDQGLLGPEGLQGVSGIQGVQGDQGLLGPQGIQGSIGAQGAQGIQGQSFLPDAIGDDVLPACPATGTSSYLDGVNGLLYFCVDGVRQEPVSFGEGPQGVQGSQGSAGIQGNQGIQGVAGVQGSQGNAGIQGSVGPQGLSGVQGVQGVSGAQGLQGEQGEQGSQGLQGIQGVEGPVGSQGIQGISGPQGITGAQGSQGDTGIGVQGPQGNNGLDGNLGPQGPQGAFGGPQGEQGIAGPQGVQGERGLDYDPNCQAPVVESIECADAKGNLAFTFSDDDIKYFHFKDFMPSAYTIAAKVDNGDGTYSTVNPNGSVITWFSNPTNQVMVVDFEPNGLYDHNHQLIEFRVVSKATGSCIGKGTWLLVVECDNCNCIVPEFTRNPNGSITLNDGKGLIEVLWPAGHSSPIQPEKPFPCDSTCELDDSETVATVHGCVETSYLDVPKWNCETSFKVGAIEHDGHLYYNLVDGNTDNPAVGTANGTYAGGFDLSGLIDFMLTKKLTDLGLI